jgi:hypothetical protein
MDIAQALNRPESSAAPSLLSLYVGRPIPSSVDFQTQPTAGLGNVPNVVLQSGALNTTETQETCMAACNYIAAATFSFANYKECEMAINENDGPLSRLMRGLGIDETLAPIAAVKRIDVQPRRLNIPEDYTDSEINAFVDEGKLPVLNAETLANGRVNEIDLRGRDIRFEYHGVFRGEQQWSCWDAKSYDGDESDMGFGDSKEMALVDLMEKLNCDCADPFCTRHDDRDTRTQKDIETERAIDDQLHNEVFGDGN